MARGLLLVLAAATGAWAQTAPTLEVDAAANRHAISPDIYGVNDYGSGGEALDAQMRVRVSRFGGDATTRYNWKFDNYNSGSDYYFENYSYNVGNPAQLPAGSYFDRMVSDNLASGTKTLATVPLIGWTTKGPEHACSFSVAKYGTQDKVDPYDTDCGNGQRGGQWLTGTDPHDTSTPVDERYYEPWIAHLVSTFGPGNQGGVAIWSLDNEPEWWMGVHHDVHPAAATYDEMWRLDSTFAQMIKAADPTALVSGPVPSGWMAYFYSAADFVSGWSAAPYQYNDNPTDRNAHGGVAWLDWFLQQMQAYEAAHGQRLLDYLDLHAYIAPNGISFGEATSAAVTELRMKSTRAFWDPDYLVPDVDPATPIRLIPRMRDWVANDYPGTKIAITEYNWGALDDITGAVAEADILGIFGRESLDLATLWGPPAAGQPGVFAFQMYGNYDGAGGKFGETSVAATSSNPDQVAVYAAERSDLTLTVMVINKTAGAIAAPVAIAHFAAAGTARVYQYSAANLNAIVRLPDAALTAQGVAGQYPAYSITLFEIPADDGQFAVAEPVVNAVVNAASYGGGIAPGEIVTLFGTGMGPAALQGAALDANGLVATSLGGVKIYFEGIAAPLIYVSATQAAAIVPYFVGNLSTVHVAVENQGRRSAAIAAPVSAAAPGIFSVNQQGTGQGAILNQDGRTVNSAAHPAAAGSVVSVFVTGLGQTTPPGFDGKRAGPTLPAPVEAVSVTVGGAAAEVEYAGAAPGFAGISQMNVRIPASTAAGEAAIAVRAGKAEVSNIVTVAVGGP